MHRYVLFLVVIAISVLLSPSARACDSFEPLTADEARSLMDVIKSENADAFDKIFAFDKLACSDSPVIRDYAMREGLASKIDSVTRAQILLATILQKSRYHIILMDDAKLGVGEKAYVRKNGGNLYFDRSFADRENGCVGLYYDRCDHPNLYIRGWSVLLNTSRLRGEFKLQEDTRLMGFVQPQGIGPIPAELDLFE
jgi:hypothetical protein